MDKIKKKKIPKAIEGTMQPNNLEYEGSCIQSMNADSPLSSMISKVQEQINIQALLTETFPSEMFVWEEVK